MGLYYRLSELPGAMNHHPLPDQRLLNLNLLAQLPAELDHEHKLAVALALELSDRRLLHAQIVAESLQLLELHRILAVHGLLDGSPQRERLLMALLQLARNLQQLGVARRRHHWHITKCTIVHRLRVRTRGGEVQYHARRLLASRLSRLLQFAHVVMELRVQPVSDRHVLVRVVPNRILHRLKLTLHLRHGHVGRVIVVQHG